jgi:hypothetical protein
MTAELWTLDELKQQLADAQALEARFSNTAANTKAQRKRNTDLWLAQRRAVAALKARIEAAEQ